MKNASFPSIRVEPELKAAAESVLREGESLSSLILTAVRETIERRRTPDPAPVADHVEEAHAAPPEAPRPEIPPAKAPAAPDLRALLNARRRRAPV